MLVGVISDIHGNLPALQAVRECMGSLGVDEVVCTGDIVGYGANPKECLEIVSETSYAAVSGNHESGVLCKGASEFFNRVAREACEWTKEILGPWEMAYLRTLPLTVNLDEWGVVLAHAEVWEPGLFDYILGFYDASENLKHLEDGTVCFVGHSHAPFVFRGDKLLKYAGEGEVQLARDERTVVNVGSVGQPRDGDRRACFATFDTDERRVKIHRVWYDFEQSARYIREAGLPPVLGDRLKYGR